MTPNNTVFVHGTNQPLQLGKLLGEGGRGRVYEIASASTPLVAKLYKQPLNPNQSDKLRAMAQSDFAALKRVAAMPLQLVTDSPTQRGNVIGYVMRRVPEYKEIHHVTNPQARLAAYPIADWRWLLRLARNVSIAIHQVHHHGVVLGDINDRNFAVHTDFSVTVMDADSWQWTNGSNIFRCEEGVPMFTPPELHSIGHFASMDRTQNHDLFGLSVLIFQLLFMGRHPYIGRYKGGAADMRYDRAIPEHRFAYGKNSRRFEMERPPGMPALSIVGPQCSALFESAFAPNAASQGRPTALQWNHAIEQAETELCRCNASDNHFFHRSLAQCPWCEIESSNSFFFFPASLSAELAHVDTKLAEMKGSIALLSFPPPSLAGLSSLAVNQPLIFTEATSVADAKQYVVKLRKTLDDLDAQWKRLANGYYETLCSDAEHKKLLTDIEALRQQFANIKNSIEKTRNHLLIQGREIETNDYLSRFILGPSSVPGIGPALCATLQSYGVSSAADITTKNLTGIPGIGNKRIGDLMAWRTVLTKSMPQSRAKADEASVDRHLGRTFAPKLRPISAELSKLVPMLATSKIKIDTRRREAYEAFVGVGVKLLQAKSAYNLHAEWLKSRQGFFHRTPLNRQWASNQTAVSSSSGTTLLHAQGKTSWGIRLLIAAAFVGVLLFVLLNLPGSSVARFWGLADSNSVTQQTPARTTSTPEPTSANDAIQGHPGSNENAASSLEGSMVASRALEVYEFSQSRTGIVCSLQMGDRVWIIEGSIGGEASPWIKIDNRAGCTGFVSKTYIK